MSLLHSELKVITEWIPDGVIVTPFDFEINALNRCELIEDFYQSRLFAMDKDLIEFDKLTKNEKNYLFNYNLLIYCKLYKFLNKDERKWLLSLF